MDYLTFIIAFSKRLDPVQNRLVLKYPAGDSTCARPVDGLFSFIPLWRSRTSSGPERRMLEVHVKG